MVVLVGGELDEGDAGIHHTLELRTRAGEVDRVAVGVGDAGDEDRLEELPERLIVGMGAASQMRPDPAMLERLGERGIEVECLPTDRAVTRFGELDPTGTAAALHLTC